jgi:hypothetical protein
MTPTVEDAIDDDADTQDGFQVSGTARLMRIVELLARGTGRNEERVARVTPLTQPHSDIALLVISQPMPPHRNLRLLAVISSYSTLTIVLLTVASLQTVLIRS